MKNQLIKTFINDIANKDYKKAHNSLSSVVEMQLASRVKIALAQKKQTEKDK